MSHLSADVAREVAAILVYEGVSLERGAVAEGQETERAAVVVREVHAVLIVAENSIHTKVVGG